MVIAFIPEIELMSHVRDVMPGAWPTEVRHHRKQRVAVVVRRRFGARLADGIRGHVRSHI